MEQLQVEEIIIYRQNNEIVSVSSIIDGVQHCTGDVRNEQFRNNIQAVFSRITIDPIIFNSIQQCVEYGIYSQEAVKYKQIHVDHYIYIDLDI